MQKVVYNRLKAVLAERGVSNKELAEGIGVRVEAVSNWCVQKRQPSWENLYAIADFLGVDVRALLIPNEKSPTREFQFTYLPAR
jgi:transcriptional regulator with XRE-family HTH domain